MPWISNDLVGHDNFPSQKTLNDFFFISLRRCSFFIIDTSCQSNWHKPIKLNKSSVTEKKKWNLWLNFKLFIKTSAVKREKKIILFHLVFILFSCFFFLNNCFYFSFLSLSSFLFAIFSPSFNLSFLDIFFRFHFLPFFLHDIYFIFRPKSPFFSPFDFFFYLFLSFSLTFFPSAFPSICFSSSSLSSISFFLLFFFLPF